MDSSVQSYFLFVALAFVLLAIRFLALTRKRGRLMVLMALGSLFFAAACAVVARYGVGTPALVMCAIGVGFVAGANIVQIGQRAVERP